VIEREVIQPTVVRTTAPTDERTEYEPTFHPPTVQPEMVMEEFLKAGGTLEGRGGICEISTGEPRVHENDGGLRTEMIVPPIDTHERGSLRHFTCTLNERRL